MGWAAALDEAVQDVPVGAFNLAARGVYDRGAGPGGDDQHELVVHRGQDVHAAELIEPLLRFDMGRIGGRTGPVREAAHHVLPAVEQNDLVEAGAGLAGNVLDLLDELRPAKELRDYGILSGRQVGPRGGKDYRAREAAGRFRLLAPSTDKAPDAIDVQIQ